jgi:glycosyltransferase involved in cell wall biosynthesis
MFENAASLYGGTLYESMIRRALGSEHKVTLHNSKPWVAHGYRPQSFIRTAFAELASSVDCWIRNEIALTCMTATRNKRQIGLIHHLDERVGPSRLLNGVFYRRLLANARRCDQVVVVSKHWKDRLADLGVPRTTLIYNAFDLTRFAINADEIRLFKKQNGLLGKPVVYIGNCRLEKGAPAVWDALRQEPYNFVTSGLGNINLPVRKFLLSYRDYILLLAASDVVVTMSRFEEGWNRTAHEAMLCKTPVIGSGAGGMEELLLGGDQLVCHDERELPELVRTALAQKDHYSTKGHAFASTFTIERFTEEWLGLIASL